MEFTAILISIRHIILSFCASSVSEVEGYDVAMNLPLYQAVADGEKKIFKCIVSVCLGCMTIYTEVTCFAMMIIS